MRQVGRCSRWCTLRAVRGRATAFGSIAALSFGVFALGCSPPRTAPSDTVQVNIALPVEELHLPNGLHVVLHQDRSVSSALVHVRYHVGSKDDPQGRSGFAHLYEHLMFRGSRNTRAKEHMQWIEEVGGHSNAYTTLDTTAP